MSDDRGVSDLVGFVTVFGIVIVSIALIYSVGLGALTQVQHAEAMDNAERAFDIVADNMEDIQQNGAPARSTELEFAGGQIAHTGKVTMTVTNASRNLSVIFVTTPISYTSGETGFYYTAGAVVRTNDGEGVIVNDPAFRFGPKQTVLSVITATPTGDTSSIGGGTVRVSARSNGSAVRAIETGGITFNVSVSSPRYEAWAAYFERQGLDRQVVDAANQTVVYQHSTGALYVRKTQVQVELTP